MKTRIAETLREEEWQGNSIEVGFGSLTLDLFDDSTFISQMDEFFEPVPAGPKEVCIGLDKEQAVQLINILQNWINDGQG